MGARATSRRPYLLQEPELEVGWCQYPRLQPGEYPAYCRQAKVYFDRQFKRWVCMLLFDVLSVDLLQVLGRVPMWMNLGAGQKPHASYRGDYLPRWVEANGGLPSRRDRLSLSVFTRRHVRVMVSDTKKSVVPYSVVTEILSWDTGKSARAGVEDHKPCQSKGGSPKNVARKRQEGGGSKAAL